MLNFSKRSIATIFGGSMLAAVAGQDAAANTNCGNIDLRQQSSMRDAFAACLGGKAHPAAREGAPAEIENRGCRDEFDRSTSATKPNCTYTIPADKSCEQGAQASRLGNRFLATHDGRSIGTTRCTIKMP